jgi:hypothetical protein
VPDNRTAGGVRGTDLLAISLWQPGVKIERNANHGSNDQTTRGFRYRGTHRSKAVKASQLPDSKELNVDAAGGDEAYQDEENGHRGTQVPRAGTATVDCLVGPCQGRDE